MRHTTPDRHVLTISVCPGSTVTIPPHSFNAQYTRRHLDLLVTEKENTIVYANFFALQAQLPKIITADGTEMSGEELVTLHNLSMPTDMAEALSHIHAFEDMAPVFMPTEQSDFSGIVDHTGYNKTRLVQNEMPSVPSHDPEVVTIILNLAKAFEENDTKLPEATTNSAPDFLHDDCMPLGGFFMQPQHHSQQPQGTMVNDDTGEQAPPAARLFLSHNLPGLDILQTPENDPEYALNMLVEAFSRGVYTDAYAADADIKRHIASRSEEATTKQPVHEESTRTEAVSYALYTPDTEEEKQHMLLIQNNIF